MSTPHYNEDTVPLQAVHVSELNSQFGLWRLQQRGQPSGKLVASLSRIAMMTIGREAGNSLTLDDATVSRQHCRILLDDTGVPGRGPWVVEDLGARNGTWVGLDRLAPGGRATIHAGQTLRVGTVLLWLGDGNTEDLGPLSNCIPGFSLGRCRLIKQLSAMVKGAQPIFLVGPHGSGRRAIVSWLVRAVGEHSRAVRLSSSDSGAWLGAMETAQSANRPVSLIAGPLESLAPDVQSLMAKLIAVQVAAAARGEPPKWQLIGWASPAVLPFASSSDPLIPEMRQALHGAMVEVERLDLHREDLPAIVESMRRAFHQISLQELAAIDNGHAAEVCAQVQRWVHQRWPGNLAEVAGMALPNHEVEEVLSKGLPAQSGSWTPEPLAVTAPTAEGERAAAPRRNGSDSGGIEFGEREQTRPATWLLDGERDSNWYTVALADPVTLWQAIHAIFSGNIKAFCDEAGVQQGRNPESVRRQVYRHLGDRIRTLRQ